MYLRGTFIKEYKEQDLIAWPTLQTQMALNDETYKDIVESFAQSEIFNAEIFINRALIEGEITAYFDGTDSTITGLWLPFPAETDTIEITIDDVEILSDNYSIIPDGTTKIKFTQPLINAKNIQAVYSPEVYNQRKALIPGILMKVTQYFTNPENEGNNARVDPALSIYSRHRIKTSF